MPSPYRKLKRAKSTFDQGQAFREGRWSPRNWLWGRDGRNDRVVDLGHDYESYYGELYKKNGVVFACAQTLAKPFSEIRYSMQDLNEDGRPGDFNGDDVDLLNRPWEGATGATLNTQAMQDFILAGNAYIVKEKADNRMRRPRDRLRLLRPDWVEIGLSKAAEESVRADIVAYKYLPGGQSLRNIAKPVLYLPDEVAHWMPIPDPAARWRGMSPLTPVSTEILADSASTKHKKSYFDNAATPTMTVALHETVTGQDFDDAVESITASAKGNPYAPFVFGGGADVKIVGADLKSIDFGDVQGAGETRIAAALGTHPVIVALREGMQGASLNAGNARVAKDIFIDMTLRPLFASFCAVLEKFVHPDGDKPGVRRKSRLWYDERDVAFFRADRKELTEIISLETEVYTRLIREGVTPESAADFIANGGDWSLIEHTGLVSVQLWPPESGVVQEGDAALPGAQEASTRPVKPQEDKPGTAQRGVNPNTGQSMALDRKPPQQKPRSTRNGKGSEPELVSMSATFDAIDNFLLTLDPGPGGN